MTDFTQLSDKELSEALGFHRRQRNMSRGLNESANMRQTQMVRLLEAEEARRLEEAEKPTYHYYVTHNKGDKNSDWTVTHSKKKPFATARDAADHIMKSGGRRGGTVHTVNSKTGNIVQARSYDSGQAGYARDPGIGDPRSVRDLKEEVELEEAVQVDKKNYSWGKMITVRHGSSHSFPLHPEHQEKIKNLKDGDSTAFKDETGSHVIATREGDKVHLKTGGAKSAKTTVAHSHFTEEVEQIDELSKKTLGSYIKKADKQAEKAVNSYSNAAARRHDFAPDTPAMAKNAKKFAKRDAGSALAKTKLAKMEEVEQIDEISSSTLRSYIDKSRADKKVAMKDRSAAEKNVKTYGMASDKKERDDAARRVGNRNQGISVANKKLGTYPADKAKAKVMAREEVELDEQTMPGNVALRLADRHYTAAFHHKKNSNYKGYAAHLKTAERIEDAVIRAGRDMPVKSKQLEAASDRAFRDHPHHPNRAAS